MAILDSELKLLIFLFSTAHNFRKTFQPDEHICAVCNKCKQFNRSLMKHFLFFIGKKDQKILTWQHQVANWHFSIRFFYMNMLILNPIWLHGAAALNEFPVIRHFTKVFRTTMCHQYQQPQAQLRKYLHTHAGKREFLSLSWRGRDIQVNWRNNFTFLSTFPFYFLSS